MGPEGTSGRRAQTALVGVQTMRAGSARGARLLCVEDVEQAHGQQLQDPPRIRTLGLSCIASVFCRLCERHAAGKGPRASLHDVGPPLPSECHVSRLEGVCRGGRGSRAWIEGGVVGEEMRFSLAPRVRVCVAHGRGGERERGHSGPAVATHVDGTRAEAGALPGEK
eukprot:3510428-Prymnesium_polylepis.1